MALGYSRSGGGGGEPLPVGLKAALHHKEIEHITGIDTIIKPGDLTKVADVQEGFVDGPFGPMPVSGFAKFDVAIGSLADVRGVYMDFAPSDLPLEYPLSNYNTITIQLVPSGYTSGVLQITHINRDGDTIIVASLKREDGSGHSSIARNGSTYIYGDGQLYSEPNNPRTEVARVIGGSVGLAGANYMNLPYQGVYEAVNFYGLELEDYGQLSARNEVWPNFYSASRLISGGHPRSTLSVWTNAPTLVKEAL